MWWECFFAKLQLSQGWQTIDGPHKNTFLLSDGLIHGADMVTKTKLIVFRCVYEEKVQRAFYRARELSDEGEFKNIKFHDSGC